MAKISGGNTSTALSLAKTGLTTIIQDLTIIGGNATNGGGINITSGTVKLGDGAIVTGNTATSGGGVYVGSDGTLFMSGKALIGDSATSTTRASSSGTSYYANKATNGAGIYNNGGAVYIGCDTSGQAASGYTLVNNATDGYYGVRRNYSVSDGAGIYHAAGTLKIASGDISYNFANTNGTSCGGAALLAAGATVSGGTFTGNKAANGGAFYIKSGKELTINGAASIKSNEAVLTGGAISNNGTLTMSAGTIGSADGLNSVTSNVGGAIYQNGKFTISGSAVVYAGTGVGEKQNDVYLASEKTVTAGVFETGGNSSSIPMVITPYSWTRGSTAVTAATGVTLDATKLKCFKMSDEDWSVVLHSSAGKINAPVYVASDTSTDGFKVCTGLGSDTDGTGSRAKPYATIAKALTKAWDTSKTSDLTIKIDGEVKGAQTISGTINARRVIVIGASSSYYTKPSVLNGGFDSGAPGTTLTVTTSTPVFLNHITIKGGYNASGNGGGLSVSGSASIVDMQSAWIEGNYAINGGGGVYVANNGIFEMRYGWIRKRRKRHYKCKL